MRSKYVVTGGAGFIGSNIVAALNERGEDDILVVDERGRDKTWKNLAGLRYGDFWDKDRFRLAVQQDRLDNVAAIFHMGACSSTTETNAAFLDDNNFRYTQDLCEWCRRNKIRFIYASSGATYGNGSMGYSDDDETTRRLQPLNLYGHSKQKFDLWALDKKLFGEIVGLKFFNVYGPREDHKGDMRSVINRAYGQILESGEVKLFKSYRPEYKDGEQVRDFVYVKDAVSGCLHFLDHPTTGGLYNVGTGKARTWLDLAKAVFSAMNRPPKIRFIDMPEGLREKYQYRTEADISKLRRSGYDKPMTSLEEGVREYVQGWLTHRS